MSFDAATPLPDLLYVKEESFLAALASLHAKEIDLEHLIRSHKWSVWLQQLHSLDGSRCSSAVWNFLTALCKALPTGGEPVTRLALALADPIWSCAEATEELLHPADMIDTLAAAGSALSIPIGSALEVSAGNFSTGSAAYLRLLTRISLARTPLSSASSVQAAEAWAVAALAAGSSSSLPGLGQECIALARAAESASGGLLNIAWKLIKIMCLDSRCTVDFASAVLCLAAAGCAKASSSSAYPDDGKEAAQVAKFHCCNFFRLLKEAPCLQISGGSDDFPLGAVIESFRHQLALLPSGGHSCTEMLEKMLSASIERWIAFGENSSQHTQRHQHSSDCFASCLHDEAVARFLAAVTLPLLASGRLNWAAAAQTRVSEILSVTLLASEAFFVMEPARTDSSHHRCPHNKLMDALAVLVAQGAPGARSRLLAWTAAEDCHLYSLSLVVHRFLPARFGAERTTFWAHLLLDGFVLAPSETQRRGQQLSRAQRQAASCIAVLIAGCSSNVAEAWMQKALAPLSASASPPPGLWFLSTRLCRVRSDLDVTSSLVLAAYSGVEAVFKPDSPAALEKVSRMQRLRCFSALVCSGVLAEKHVAAAAVQLRKLLASDQTPLQVRVEAWAAHANCCLHLGAATDFRVSVRYAIKYFVSLDPAGARVAIALSRVPGALLSGSCVAIRGLCSVDWPLRAVGLFAAASAFAELGASSQVREVAGAAVDAFVADYGDSAKSSADPSHSLWDSSRPGWLSNDDRKRRRLLQQLLSLPDRLQVQAAQENQHDLEKVHALCAAAQAKIGAWLS
eukprot:TRINITY_DN27209_c0_g1_i1.p1 TRINITY_DN27209_c0_g1~~TRINITY_DN27209_c0_g1_i1.p1  ORF type:complete len:796 (-),score=129.65 TRINITY_DN27209_c0_g1_i1:67-2454(-)